MVHSSTCTFTGILKENQSHCNLTFFSAELMTHTIYIKLKKFFKLLKFLAVERKLQYFTIKHKTMRKKQVRLHVYNIPDSFYNYFYFNDV